MLRKFLHAKIHRAAVTRCDPDYVGSITIDAELLAATGLRPNEAVTVCDIDNAARFETYIIRGHPGSGAIEVNGAAAKLVETGHKLIILGYGLMESHEDTLNAHASRVVVCDADNRIERSLEYSSTIDEPDLVA
ncbi:MAG: aspartate 1-decarboxylase [Planctomycetota bacterium]